MFQFPDLSHYEPDVQFHEVKAAGIPLVITKGTQGTRYLDPTCLDFLVRGRSVGLVMGAYAFINPGNGAAQADYLLNVTHLQKGDLQPIVDAEALGLSRATTVAALTELEAKGYKPILYASLSFFQDVLGSPTRWALWLAAYRTTLPTLPKGVRLFAWQYSDHGECAGVAKPCDMSRFYGTASDLATYVI